MLHCGTLIQLRAAVVESCRKFWKYFEYCVITPSVEWNSQFLLSRPSCLTAQTHQQINNIQTSIPSLGKVALRCFYLQSYQQERGVWNSCSDIFTPVTQNITGEMWMPCGTPFLKILWRLRGVMLLIVLYRDLIYYFIFQFLIRSSFFKVTLQYF